MNQLGRHYRDPLDPSTPHCNYELQGVKCTFFTTGNDLADIPYPEDITLGPVSDPSPPPSSDLSAILALLNQQKTEAEQQRVLQQQQAEQMRLLQLQVSSMLQSGRPAASVSVPTTTTVVSSSTMTTPAVTTASVLPTFSTFTAPHAVTSAAATLSSALQSGLAPQNNYTGLTMDHLRADPVMMSQAAAVLARATQNVPPLNPLDGMGTSFRAQQTNQVVINSVDQLYKATTVNKQLRSFEFAQTGQFSYRHQLL